MKDECTYALEIGNKIYTFTNRSTLEFCTDVQVRKEYRDLKDKIVIIKIDVDDIVKEEHTITERIKFE